MMFTNCHVHPHAEVTGSVVLPDVEIGEGSRLNRTIVDRGCHIPPGAVIGMDKDEDRERGFRVTSKGITLVTPEALGQQLHFTR